MPAPNRPNVGPANEKRRLKGGLRYTKTMRFTLPGELADQLEAMTGPERNALVEQALKARRRSARIAPDAD